MPATGAGDLSRSETGATAVGLGLLGAAIAAGALLVARFRSI